MTFIKSLDGGITNVNLSAGTTSNNLSNIVFSNSNGVSFGINGSTITASANAGGGLTNVNVSAGTTSNNLSNVVFSNSNNFSFGLNGSTITGSYTVPTVTNSSFSVQDSATTINPVARIAFSTGNNITLSLSTGASSATVGVQHNLAGTSTGFGGNLISASMTHNSSGLNLSLNHPAWLTTAMQSNAATISNIKVSAGTLSTNRSDISFNNSNGVSFGLETNGIITATVKTDYLTTARASTDAIGLNQAKTNVTWTVNSSGISFNAEGYAGTGTGLNLTNLTGTISVNSGGVSLSLSAGAAGGGSTESYHAIPADGLAINTATTNWSQSTSCVAPFVISQNLSVGSAVMILSGSMAASSTQATTGNTSLSAGISTTINMVLYSRGAGANSMSLQYVTSTQVIQQQAITWSVAANSSQHSVSNRVTYGTYSGTFDYSSSVTRFDYHTSNLTGLSGVKQIFRPFAFSLAPDMYWIAIGGSTSSATQNASVSVMTRMLVSFSSLAVSQNTLAIGDFGGNTNSSVMWQPALGSFSLGGAGGTTSSIAMANVSSNVSNLVPHIKFMRIT